MTPCWDGSAKEQALFISRTCARTCARANDILGAGQIRGVNIPGVCNIPSVFFQRQSGLYSVETIGAFDRIRRLRGYHVVNGIAKPLIRYSIVAGAARDEKQACCDDDWLRGAGFGSHVMEDPEAKIQIHKS